MVATCRAAERSDSSRSAPPSRSRAISAVRSASRRRVSASSARARAESANALIATAAMKNTASANQCSPSRMVKPPVGGMWKKFQAAALISAVSRPSQSPQ